MKSHLWKDEDYDKKRVRLWKKRKVIFNTKAVCLNDLTLTQAKNLLVSIDENMCYVRRNLHKAETYLAKAYDVT